MTFAMMTSINFRSYSCICNNLFMSKQDYSVLLWKEVMEKVRNLLGSHYQFEPEQLRQMPLMCENNAHEINGMWWKRSELNGPIKWHTFLLIYRYYDFIEISARRQFHFGKSSHRAQAERKVSRYCVSMKLNVPRAQAVCPRHLP